MITQDTPNYDEHSSAPVPANVRADQLNQLSPELRALMIKKLRRAATLKRKSEGIPRRPSQGPIPLSFNQQRIWFLEQVEPGTSTYNVPAVWRLQGKLDERVLSKSLNEIDRRNEALRTTFMAVDGVPQQVIGDSHELILPVVDLASVAEAQREKDVERLIAEHIQQPFDLERGPLLRFKLLRLSDTEHVLMLSVHHIVFDGWSMGLFLQQLVSLYEAFATESELPLPELPVQFADFAHWQRQWLEGEELQRRLSYWKLQLDGQLPVLELPTDRPRPAIQTYHGARHYIRITPPLTESIKALNRKEGSTLFMSLLAAFNTLLYRYCGQDDILIGSPIANRNLTEIENLIGFFANTIVLRSDLSGNPSFRELLARTRDVALGAYSHQDTPFDKLVEQLQPERNPSHHPLFQAMFVLQNAPSKTLELPGLSIIRQDVDLGTAMFDLSLSMWETEEGLKGFFEYNSDLFDSETITRMSGHFETLLDGIVTDPDQCILELPILKDAERQVLLRDWNDTQADFPEQQCIHELIEAQVDQTPDAVAVEFGQQRLTYYELNCRANQLARHLQQLGVGPESLVGICVERSLEMIVGLLGILKAGGAYVPLDPKYPVERLAYMLEDTRTAVLLTQQRPLDSLPDIHAKVVCLDRDWETIADHDTDNVSSGVTGENLAYVIYTSGSTGKPKGTMIGHRSLVNYCEAVCGAYEISPADRALQFSSISFDTSAEEIFSCLLCGAALVLRNDEMIGSVDVFLETCRDWNISVLNLPTAYWHVLVDGVQSVGLSLPPSVRLTVIGGEKASRHRLEAWCQCVKPPVRLITSYGPTEATIAATMCDLSDNTLAKYPGRELPIGTANSNTQTYILNRRLQAAPIGVPGELHIGGIGLARGYLNQSELSDAKFVPDPFNDDPDARLYKTGDLCRFFPDGNIEYLGRLDDQVKVRGYRIELGEVESALLQNPLVRAAAVLGKQDSSGDNRLVAYVVPQSAGEISADELSGALRGSLPDYMVPSAIVALDQLPLSPNKKVDRKALLCMDLELAPDNSGFVGARDDVEQQLTEIWRKLLNVQQVGVRDNFFDLGGHSLLALRLFAEIQKATGRRLPPSTLLHAVTIEQLAEMLREEASSSSWSSLVPLQTSGTKSPLFFVHSHGGEVIGYYDLARRLGTDRPFYGLQAQDLSSDTVRPRRIEEMAAHYIKEIRTVQPHGPYLLGGWCLGGAIALEMASQLQDQGETVAEVLMVHTPHPDYPRYLPGTTAVHRHMYRTLTRIDLEVSNFLEAKGREKVSYISERGKRIATNFQARLYRFVETLTKFLNIPLRSSRAYYLARLGNITNQAYCKFEPRPYRGHVTMLRATKGWRGIVPDRTLGWADVIEGQLEIKEMPGYPIGMLSEPRVQLAAATIRASLDEAEEKLPRK